MGSTQHLEPRKFKNTSSCMIVQEDIINQTAKSYSESTIHQLFLEQVQITPDAIALIFQDLRLTYRELDERSNQLAHYLRARYQTEYGQELPTETLVALLLERSAEMIIAILAIFKAGAAYVPIDPHYPDERISYILQDSKAAIICCQTKHQNKLTRLIQQSKFSEPSSALLSTAFPQHCILVDQSDWREESPIPLPDRLNNKNLAYVIYTSGTTGKPKGVMIEHSALVNRISWMQDTYPLTAHDKILQKTPYTFDVSVWELIWANLYGACIVIAPPESHKYPEELEQLINTHEITVLHFVPSMLQSFLDYLAAAQKSLAGQLCYVFCSGEALALKTVKQFYRTLNAQSQTQLHNLYGPTETAIDSTFFACSELNGEHKSVPIGRPIANTKIYILDDKHHPVAIGNTGELFIAGTGLARGYLNRPELTQERFIANPYRTEGYEYLYKTGDMVRLLSDGNIEYLGRNDSQVKIRGLRIELGEIENTIALFSTVKQCVVMVAEHVGQKHLVAYFTAEQKVDRTKIRNWLAKQLPEYMLPGLFMQLDSFAFTHNGKMDRSLLPEVNFKLLQSQYQAAENTLQQLLCDLVAETLELQQVGIEDNFFAIGGDSILSIQLAVQLRRSGYKITVRDIVSCQTVRQLAAFIESEQSSIAEECIDINSLSLNPMQQLIINHQLTSHEVLYNEHITIDFKNDSIDIEILNQAIIALLNHHQILRCYCDKDYSHFIAGPILDNTAKIVAFNQIPAQQVYRHELNRLLNQPFDLQRGPLYRFALFQIGETKYKLTAIFHHLIADGDAMYNLFVPQLKILLADVGTELPQATAAIHLPPMRQDFKALLSGMHSLDLFSGSAELSTGLSGNDRTDSEGTFIVEYLSAQETRYLSDLARQQGVSFYSLLLSATYLLLYKISGETRLCVGGVKSLRSALSEPVFGNLLVNEINVIDIEENKTFSDLLQAAFEAVQQSLLSTLPYANLLQEIRRHSEPAEKLPNVFMTLEPKMAGDNRWYITQNEGLPSHVKYELYFEFDLQEQLELRIEYRHQSYTQAQIQILTKSLRGILTSLQDKLDLPLKTFSLLSEMERRALIYDYNQTEQPYPEVSIQA
ncbi:MAG: amino acid adenylation domain-containing protein, partial [Pseudomonadota bacterium]